MRSLAVLFLHLGWENLGLHPLITGTSAKLRSVFCSPKEDAEAGLPKFRASARRNRRLLPRETYALTSASDVQYDRPPHGWICVQAVFSVLARISTSFLRCSIHREPRARFHQFCSHGAILRSRKCSNVVPLTVVGFVIRPPCNDYRNATLAAQPTLLSRIGLFTVDFWNLQPHLHCEYRSLTP